MGLPGDVIRRYSPTTTVTCEWSDGKNPCTCLATVQIQGETDSFGYEVVDLCEEHLAQDREKEQKKRSKPQSCDWCKKAKTGVRAHRDWTEGSHGPVYQVCTNCRLAESAEIQAEIEYDRRMGYDWD